MAPKTTSKERGTKSRRVKRCSSIVKPKSNKVSTIQYLRIKCPICFENINLESISSTKCGHVFCTHCLQKALKRSSLCPTCRTRLKGSRGHHPLYLDTNACEEVELHSEFTVEVSDKI